MLFAAAVAPAKPDEWRVGAPAQTARQLGAFGTFHDVCFPTAHQCRQTPASALHLQVGSQQPGSPGAVLFLGMQRGAAAFRGVREAKVTTNCYHWSFLREVRRGKCLIINWLPPRDSNPDMLIQRQSTYGSCHFLHWQLLPCKLLSFLGFKPTSSARRAIAEYLAQ